MWKLNTNENAINLYDSISKRNMFITTSEPGVVVYTMNHADNPMLLSNGKLQEIHYAVCLETQKPAIGYNEQGRQAVILKPGEIYTQHTMFKFTVK